MLTTSSILLTAASILIAILLPVCSAYFRKLRKAKPYNGTEGIRMPDISVIISAFDNPDGVLKKLPSFLTQQYTSDYEVILVVNNEKVREEAYQYQLDQLPNRERLKVTYVPDSSHYMGLQKLAVTLGVKAAKHEWVLLTDAHCQPLTDKWLAVMARNCAGKDMVLGYTNIRKDPYVLEPQKEEDLQRFERMLWQLYNLRQAERGIAYSTAGGNLMFKKSMFMNGKGFSGNLRYTYGEYEFLVNTYAKAGNVAVETHPDSWCARDKYSEHEFDLYHRCFQETRRHLLRKWEHRAIIAADQATLHLSFPIVLVMLLYSLNERLWIPVLAAPLALALGLLLREYLAKKALKRFRIELKTRFITKMEISILWQHVRYRMKYYFADKSEFISHKY